MVSLSADGIRANRNGLVAGNAEGFTDSNPVLLTRPLATYGE